MPSSASADASAPVVNAVTPGWEPPYGGGQRVIISGSNFAPGAQVFFGENAAMMVSFVDPATIQAWSPFQHGFFAGAFLDNPKFPELNQAIDKIAKAHGVSNTTIAIAWILRHPARMQAIVGTTNVQRVRDSAKAGDVDLSRPEWYELYRAAGNKLP